MQCHDTVYFCCCCCVCVCAIVASIWSLQSDTTAEFLMVHSHDTHTHTLTRSHTTWSDAMTPESSATVSRSLKVSENCAVFTPSNCFQIVSCVSISLIFKVYRGEVHKNEMSPSCCSKRVCLLSSVKGKRRFLAECSCCSFLDLDQGLSISNRTQKISKVHQYDSSHTVYSKFSLVLIRHWL